MSDYIDQSDIRQTSVLSIDLLNEPARRSGLKTPASKPRNGRDCLRSRSRG